MKILKSLNQQERNVLRQTILKHLQDGNREYLLTTHIDSVLNKPYCFMVDVFARDFVEIFILANLPLSEYPYQTLATSIAYIRENQTFLETKSDGYLSGERVKHYISLLEDRQNSFAERFIELGDCFLHDGIGHPARTFNITEGMHKLVAFGLATDMHEIHFPIPMIFGSDVASLPSNVIE